MNRKFYDFIVDLKIIQPQIQLVKQQLYIFLSVLYKDVQKIVQVQYFLRDTKYKFVNNEDFYQIMKIKKPKSFTVFFITPYSFVTPWLPFSTPREFF